jgi:hypothetical protein
MFLKNLLEGFIPGKVFYKGCFQKSWHEKLLDMLKMIHRKLK